MKFMNKLLVLEIVYLLHMRLGEVHNHDNVFDRSTRM